MKTNGVIMMLFALLDLPLAPLADPGRTYDIFMLQIFHFLKIVSLVSLAIHY